LYFLTDGNFFSLLCHGLIGNVADGGNFKSFVSLLEVEYICSLTTIVV